MKYMFLQNTVESNFISSSVDKGRTCINLNACYSPHVGVKDPKLKMNFGKKEES